MADPLHASTETPKQAPGGFPPFKTETFPSQIFWLVVCFAFLFAVVWRIAGPRINGVITSRRGVINADIAAAAPQGQFTAAQFRDRLDNGRKVAIQILEFFDRHGVTLRRGDLRRINRHRLDLFGAPPSG